MENKFATQISFFTSLHAKVNSTYTLQQIVELIQNETYKNEIITIRAEHEKSKQNDLKKLLPAITVSGLFYGQRKKENLVEHSGLIQIDIDNVENLNHAKQQLLNDKYSMLLFESPSGKGLKIIVQISNDKNVHEQHFLELERYYLFHYNIKIDKQCKDVTRLMYLCSDKNIFINENANQYQLNKLTMKETNIAKALQKINRTIDFKSGNRNAYVFQFACECNRLEVAENDCISYCLQHFQQHDFNQTEIEQTVKSGFVQNTKAIQKNNLETTETQQFFKARTANQCLDDASKMPIPKMLFGELWHEYELCILFADTNVGKSILGIQIADYISRGNGNSVFKMEAKKQLVLYVDFELSDKQFEIRYSFGYSNPYQFDDNLIRVTINIDCTDYENFDKILWESIEKLVNEYDCKIIIIDNITFLKTESTETARDALPLIKKLTQLKKKYGLSILALAHTPKRNLCNQISQNDLSGSKHLANFVDSMFSIGKSHKNENLRYIKQIKARSTGIFYDGDNVLVCEIIKEFNFLCFSFVEFGNEKEHLKQISVTEKKELESEIVLYKNANPTATLRDICKEFNITSANTVKRILDKNDNNSQIL